MAKEFIQKIFIASLVSYVLNKSVAQDVVCSCICLPVCCTTVAAASLDCPVIKQNTNNQQNIGHDLGIKEHADLEHQNLIQQLLAHQQQLAQIQLTKQHLDNQQLTQAHQNLVQQQIAQQQLAQEQLKQQNLAQQQLAQHNLVQQQLAQENLAQQQLAQHNLVKQQLENQHLSQQRLVQQAMATQLQLAQQLQQILTQYSGFSYDFIVPLTPVQLQHNSGLNIRPVDQSKKYLLALILSICEDQKDDSANEVRQGNQNSENKSKEENISNCNQKRSLKICKMVNEELKNVITSTVKQSSGQMQSGSKFIQALMPW